MKKSPLAIMMILEVVIISSCSKDVTNKVNGEEPLLQSNQCITSEEFLALQVKTKGKVMPFEEAVALYKDILPLTKGESVNADDCKKTLWINVHSGAYTKSSETEKVPVYVVKTGDIHTLISGDRRVKGILAEIENYNESNVKNHGVEFFFDGLQMYMEREIERFNRHYDSLLVSVSDKMNTTKAGDLDDSQMWLTTSSRSLRDEVKPNLLKVTWGQEYPYNKTLDTVTHPIGFSVIPPVGCTNVAVAQIMSHYKYPTTYVYANKTYSFDWDKMTSNPKAFLVKEPFRTQIADLMYIVGKATKTEYTWTSGTTGTVKLMAGLDELNYTYQRSAYSFSSVRNSLIDDTPVYMEGEYTDTNKVQHAHSFILSGYKSNIIEYTDRVYKYIGGENGNPNELNSTDWVLFSEDISTTEFNSVYINWGYDGDDDGYYTSYALGIVGNKYVDKAKIFLNVKPKNNQ